MMNKKLRRTMDMVNKDLRDLLRCAGLECNLMILVSYSCSTYPSVNLGVKVAALVF